MTTEPKARAARGWRRPLPGVFPARQVRSVGPLRRCTKCLKPLEGRERARCAFCNNWRRQRRVVAKLRAAGRRQRAEQRGAQCG